MPQTVADEIVFEIEQKLTYLCLKHAVTIQKEFCTIRLITQMLSSLREKGVDIWAQTRSKLSELPVIRKIARDIGLRSVIAEISSTSRVDLYHYGLICALPGKWILSDWHQDAYASDYIHLVMNIPLVRTSADNGGLRVIEDGHKLGFLMYTTERASDGTKARPRIVDPNQKGLERKRQLTIDTGSFVLLDRFSPHSGGDNSSALVRLVLTARYTKV
jgi:hypothetical protein